MLHTQEAASSSLAAPTTNQQLTDVLEGSTSCVSGQDVTLRSHCVTNSVTSLPDDLVQLSDGSVVSLRSIYGTGREYIAGERRRRWLFLHGPCRHCGSWERLEVDHVDPAEKEVQAHSLWGASDDRRNTELAKCQVLCYFCHRVKHAPGHGTVSRYSNLKCRCTACRNANRVAKATRRAKYRMGGAQCQKSE